MTDAEHHHQRLLRFARIRRLKLLLRYVPRRARFHTYPVVGRFAEFARKRSYLWSFRYSDLRPAFYAGSILSLMPAIGVQLPVAFILCLLLRTNFMVAGGLQFVTNIATAVFVYPVTYKVGAVVLSQTGWGPAEAVPPVPPPEIDEAHTATVPEPAADNSGHLLGNWLADLAAKFRVNNLTHLFNCLVVGGLIVGTVMGAVIDLLWRKLIMPAAQHRAARKPITATVTPHGTPPPPDA